MAATLTEIAGQVGVSIAVVSRLLRKDPTLRISESRRREILAVKEKLGGVKTCRRRPSKLTKVIITPINRIFAQNVSQENFFAATELYQTMEQELKDKGFRMHVSFFEETELESFFDTLIKSKSCDGLMLMGSGVVNISIARLLRNYDFPHISNSLEAEELDLNTVMANYDKGLNEAIRHLKDLGHEKIGFFGPKAKGSRYAPVLAAMVTLDYSASSCIDYRFEYDSRLNNVTRNIEQSKLQFEKLLEKGIEATAIVCSNDHFALGVLNALKTKKLEAGKYVSIIGYDNAEQRLMKLESPVLTTVDNPTDLIGRRAAERLLNQILYGQTQITHERIPTKLIIRSTTGPCSR